jgi:hypothetical protein
MKHLALACLMVLMSPGLAQSPPDPGSKDAPDSVSASEVHFGCSDKQVTDAFNPTGRKGRPMAGSALVRLCHDPADNAVLRTEIEAVSDVARSPDRPAAASDGRALALPGRGPVPWYGTFVVLFILADLAAIVAMAKPYLATFFPLASMPIQDREVTALFDADGKLRLAETLACLDGERRSIWLRSRGFNNIRSIGVIAQFTTDESGRHITGQIIRCSSGQAVAAAFVTLDFVVTIGGTAGGDLRALLAGCFLMAAVVAAVAFVTIPRLCRRMERLARDALGELTGPEPPPL